MTWSRSLVNAAQQGGGYLPRWVQTIADSHGMNNDLADKDIREITIVLYLQ